MKWGNEPGRKYKEQSPREGNHNVQRPWGQPALRYVWPVARRPVWRVRSAMGKVAERVLWVILTTSDFILSETGFHWKVWADECHDLVYPFIIFFSLNVCGMWDLSSSRELGIETTATGRWSLNHWTTGEICFTLLKSPLTAEGKGGVGRVETERPGRTQASAGIQAEASGGLVWTVIGRK